MESLDGIIWSYVVFFTVLFFLVTYGGFGEYLTAGELPEPSTNASIWDLINPLNSSSIVSYFFAVMTYNVELGSFTILITAPFLFLMAVWIARWARGN
jgi:hypothetical protein